MCFSLVNHSSAENVKAKWIVEVRKHCPDKPIILVGTKKDLRSDEAFVSKLKNMGQKVVTTEEGEKLARDIKAVKYIECSARTKDNLKTVFDEAILAVLYPEEPERKKPTCNIL